MVILENAYKVVTACPSCGTITCFYVDEADYHAWECGACIQDAMPYLTAEQRELLMGGVCGDCWQKAFGNEEDAEGEEIPLCTDEEFLKILDGLDEFIK